mmetsp:Transcript_49654/g.105714  ORF Transcript_49654/g.105714 Transcript_49654/m.105714 type:complete len:574 (-) Transcript_49654:339-2060(-)|eukprot:CAMPEP_0206502628 /NCGR_PEP_ID=MMETSP0324_2-20121206/54125_1 /ASSEMBLY_ACC=CAM_ASM_000836 /TAXON_ID=2866 /ORGANISM="Crypthecodinium cohnii, Strain Seligo" /LENGTH=573 /DNA_ID=CAMNT_0053990887 /DNA_START=117 /DNA_END=1838 /DNA_ORIENTATION=-
MAPQLIFQYNGQRVKVPAPSPPTVEAAQKLAQERLVLSKGSYDLFDRYGRIDHGEDLQRAMHLADGQDCLIEVREHEHYARLRRIEDQNKSQDERLAKLETFLTDSNARVSQIVQVAKDEIMASVNKLNNRVENDIKVVLDATVQDKLELQKDVRNILEFTSQIDLEELKQNSADTAKLGVEVKDAVRRVNDMQASWETDKMKLNESCAQTKHDLEELQKYIQGKFKICIEADADLRREQQLVSERVQLLSDDLRILTEDHKRLEQEATNAFEAQVREFRTLLGSIREDTEHLKHDHGIVNTRVHCLEGTALDVWEGFMPGVLYFQRFHRVAKGDDVQFSPDFQVATGRGFLAATGLVVGNNEGLAVADGPCRRFGTPGSHISYFEVEVTEIKPVPAGMGGLWVGVSLQSAEEIVNHPAKEFDGWLVGGFNKAMSCRCGTPAELPVDPDKIPETFCPGANDGRGMGNVEEALKLLREALPPRLNGRMQEFGSNWNSQTLQRGDRIGVLWKCTRDNGARMRISVNGVVQLTQQFPDAPSAKCAGFFTPVIRLAGSGKSAKILPGISPPSRMMAD